jgi:hypothetical protein
LLYGCYCNTKQCKTTVLVSVDALAESSSY